MSASLLRAIEAALGERPVNIEGVLGGDINEAFRVELPSGDRLFVKARPGARVDEFAAEAAALRWLAEPRAIRVAEPVAVGGEVPFLALRWIPAGRLGPLGEEELGRGLAAMHAAGAPRFGAVAPETPGAEGGAPPTRIGPIVLPNDPHPTWASFYAECRLRPLIARAVDAGALSDAGRRAVEAVAERMDELAGPEERPSRLHGDLWSGNVLAGLDGCPWLIDPAAHGGHRELDLAMLELFGGLRPRVLDAYGEIAPLAAGREERVGLWQLVPLLIHAVLFAGPYGDSAARIARRYLKRA